MQFYECEKCKNYTKCKKCGFTKCKQQSKCLGCWRPILFAYDICEKCLLPNSDSENKKKCLTCSKILFSDKYDKCYGCNKKCGDKKCEKCNRSIKDIYELCYDCSQEE